MMNNRQGGEALINFISSRFKNGGMVAKFQDGGDVDDDYGTFGAEELGASVEDTAASEDIGAISGDTGDVEDIDEDLGTFPEEAITGGPPPDDTGDDTGDSDSVVSTFTTEQLEKAVDAIEKARYPSAVQQDMLANMRAELSARAAIQSGLLEDEALSVTEAARQISPVEYLADVSTPMVSGAFVDSLGRGVMADVPGASAQQAMNYTSDILTGKRGSGNQARTTGDIDTGFAGARGAGVGFDDPLQEGLDYQFSSPEGAATELLSTPLSQVAAESRAIENRDRMLADMASVPAVDADDMAGIGAVAPRSAVQGPPSGGIAGAINYTGKEIADQQAADAAMSMAAPPAGGIGDLGPVTPDELDEAEDTRGRQAALADDLDTADDLGPFGEEEILSGVRDLQNKKAGLAGLGVLAGSPITAAAPFARDIYKTLANPDVKAGELLAGKGLGRDQTAEEVVNEKGERIGVVVSDPSGVVSVQPTSIEAAFDPALRDAYSKLNERESEERERGSGDNQELATLDDPEVEEAAGPQKPPTIDIIPFRPQDFYYFTPGNYAYNRGLPSMMNMRKG